ncbi:iron complex transport system permease protein [Alicyclobacillus macrosporangiidus]|uniref:Iron complex transport system permease protein n=1 Tax=Alicyclobacillus macrosporangiidus TaxID=392015 RepID=A0A1I7JL62_9BACL|nr:iron complex transport system permease protein [Alicyclobacillus macrosporangiidus]
MNTTSVQTRTASGDENQTRAWRRLPPLAKGAVWFGGMAALVLAAGLSVAAGASNLSLHTVWQTLMGHRPGSIEEQIVWGLRIPRTLCAILTGSSFAVAGAIMQGMTRNPLADAGLLGLNAGAGLALAICFALAPGLSYLNLTGCGFAGAAMGAGLVFGIGSLSPRGLTPVRLTLAGAAVSTLFTALSEAVAIHFQVGQDLAFWYAGGIAGARWLQVKLLFPWVIAALTGALLMARSVTLLSLGDDVAAGLGQRTGWVKMACALIVLVLAGGAVSVVGSVSFVGLIIPHIARRLVGVDYRQIIPASALLGSLLMLLADVAARMVHPPYETPVGALIALIGVPFFILLIRRGGKRFE